ncbi:MAG TPA: tetratricopeptide repeat protein [Opitutaceae bacterium]|nr:tetratricopeptide repeat protein [Opitutaceae bacterium]
MNPLRGHSVDESDQPAAAENATRAPAAQALRTDPASIETLARHAASCADHDDWPAAESAWRSLLSLRPHAIVALTGLAIALREQERWTESLAAFRTATAAHPQIAAAQFNLGTCLLACNEAREAVATLRTALALDPSPETRFNLALAFLKSGAFKTGALAYEARWQAEWRGKERPFSGRRWTGAALPADEPLLLWGEQGIGDEIMFSSLVAAATTRAGGPVFLECAPRLEPLFRRSFPGIEVVARTTTPDPRLPSEAAQSPLGSLPGALWPATGAPPVAGAFLRADPVRVATLRAELTALGPGRKVGIAWRGGHPAAKRPRVIPPEAWPRLFGSGDSIPVCLQHGPEPAELAALERALGRTVHRIASVDPLVDMDAFAALIAALDGVVAVDNSTVHLAGALGAPAAVLLGFESDWRWGVDGVPCPWYSCVVRLRQKAPRDWTEPMAAAAEFIRQLQANA